VHEGCIVHTLGGDRIDFQKIGGMIAVSFQRTEIFAMEASEIKIGELITLREAAKLVPTNGRRVHTSTLWRWCIKGCRGARLEHLRAGARIVTSRAALLKFFEELTKQDHISVDPKVRRNQSAARKAEIDAAMRATAEVDS